MYPFIEYIPDWLFRRKPELKSENSSKNNSKGDSFADEPINMMDLVMQMNKQKDTSENVHPNVIDKHEDDDSDNDSFESDDILDALEYNDTKSIEKDEYIKPAIIQNNLPIVVDETNSDNKEDLNISKNSDKIDPDKVKEKADKLSKMTDYELGKHIEHVLRPNIWVRRWAHIFIILLYSQSLLKLMKNQMNLYPINQTQKKRF